MKKDVCRLYVILWTLSHCCPLIVSTLCSFLYRLETVRCSVTWPRWPSNQERAWGLLKRDILCVYQACRTSSFAVQKANRAPSPAANPARSWRRDILRNRDAKTAAAVTGGSFSQTRPPTLQYFHRNTDATIKDQLPPKQFISYISIFLIFNFDF